MSGYYVESASPEMSKYGVEFFPVLTLVQGATTMAHIHSSLEFIYVESGVFEVTVDNRQTLTVYPESLLIFRANTIHTIKHASPGEAMYYVLKVSPSLVFDSFIDDEKSNFILPFLQKKSTDIVCISQGEIPDRIHSLWGELIAEDSNSSSFYSAVRINAKRLLLSLVRTVLLPRGSEEDKYHISEYAVSQIYSVVSFVNDNFSSDLTPTQCAELIHVSYGYFAKLFRSVMGKTFKEYLLDVRMSQAHAMLLTSDRSVTEIALACGYSNLSYFVSEYRKTFGKTPGATQKESGRQVER